MNKLTKFQIFAAKDLQTKEVDLTKWWNGSVEISCFNIQERLDLDEKLKGIESPFERMYQWIILGCVNPDGSKMFTEDDIKELAKKDMAPVKVLFEEIAKLNALSQETIEKKRKNC